MDWETLRSSCLACTRCELCKTRTNVVFGQGVEDAEVLFVGEGPGQNEDEQGLPFVGRSGQLLDKYLFAIDLDARRTAILQTSSSAARRRTVTPSLLRAKPVCPGCGSSSAC